MTRCLGVLGGTFDPVHFGHLDAAEAARSALALTDVLFVPSHDPPHRPVDPRASAFHRFAMVALATNGCPGYRVSDLELLRTGTSYTADTLRSLHAAGWHPGQLFFILGTDACAEIATWHEFPAVLDAAHFVVVARPGTTGDQALARSPALRRRHARSKTERLDENGPTGVFLVETDTRDISSTTIRQRLAARRPIDDLVPPGVARHIALHHLYQLEDNLHGSDKNNDGA
ncbi:MAG: nicotinate-nucleotide adenylyltransferase [Vicinamibacterales bacterium]